MNAEISLSDATLERLPPQSLEAEQAVLGALLVSGDGVSRVVDILDPEYFYRKAHQVIYAAMLDLYEENEPIDIVTVSQYLKDEGKLENVGGRQYITDLSLSVATTANLEYYAKVVQEKAILRQLIKAGTEIVGSCYEETDADTALDRAEHTIFTLAQRREMHQLIHIKNIVEDSFQRIEQRYENRDSLSGVPSGFYDLDALTSGFQPSDLIIIAARPSMGKCLAYDSEIVLSDGRIATIEEIYKSKQAELLTLGDDLKLRMTSPSAFVDDGVKPVFRVTTRLGRSIETTLSHPFLTMSGWQKLEQLKVGDKIALPRKVPVFGTNRIRDCEVKLMAYLIGDGTTTQKVSFTNSNERIQEDFERAASEFGATAIRHEFRRGKTPQFHLTADHRYVSKHREFFAINLKQSVKESKVAARQIAHRIGVSPAALCNWQKGQSVPSPETFDQLCSVLGTSATILAPNGLHAIRWTSKSQITMWLEQLGLYGKTAGSKKVPPIIFSLTKDQVALFLNRLFATDGWVSKFRTGQVQIGYCTVSKMLARQVQHLLLRFGVVAKLRARTVAYKNERRHAFCVEMTGRQSIESFARDIGIFGKETALESALVTIRERRNLKSTKDGASAHANRDLIPIEVWQSIEDGKASESWASLARRCGFQDTTNIHAHRRSLTRGRLLSIAEALKNSVLKNLATSDVYWDDIVSIESVGVKQVYDLTIPETHNFVANDICVHNTALVLNMAQHVAVEHSIPVAIFSLEMSKESLVMRMLCSEAEIDANRLRTGHMHTTDWTKLASAMGRLGESPIYIDDSALVNALEIRAKCRRLKAEMNGLGLVIIDYIQLMQGRKQTDNRVQEVSEISRSLKTLAREINVPVIALSQLSRAVEARQNKRPMLSDLRESGSIEQDADLVMFIYRDEYYNPESDRRGEAEIIISKQRNGPTGTVDLLYQGSITRFLNKVHTQYLQV